MILRPNREALVNRHSGSEAQPGTSSAQVRNRLTLLAVIALIGGAVVYRSLSKEDSQSGNSVTPSVAVTEIFMWDQEEARNTAHLDRWIKAFEAENPGVSITRQTFQNEELRTRFTTFATGGQAPELVYGPNDNAGVFATANLIAPVDDLVDLSRFTDASLGVVKLKGAHMGVPVSYGNHLMLYFNKKLVSAAPQSTDELIQSAKTFSNPDKNEFGFVFNQIEPFWVAPFLGGFGGWPLSYDASGKATISLDTDAMVRTLTFMKDLKFKHKVVPSECDYDCAKGLFLEGKAPYTINGDWVLQEFTEGLGAGNLGIAPLPLVSETGMPSTPMVSGRYIFLSSSIDPKKKEKVLRFVNYLTSRSIQIEVAQFMNRIPATVEALESPEVQGLEDLKPLIDAARNGRPMPPDAEMRPAWDSMRPALQKLMAGSLEPRDAARLMQQSALEQLASMKE